MSQPTAAQAAARKAFRRAAYMMPQYPPELKDHYAHYAELRNLTPRHQVIGEQIPNERTYGFSPMVMRDDYGIRPMTISFWTDIGTGTILFIWAPTTPPERWRTWAWFRRRLLPGTDGGDALIWDYSYRTWSTGGTLLCTGLKPDTKYYGIVTHQNDDTGLFGLSDWAEVISGA